MTDKSFEGNPLLPELQKLHQMYHKLLQRYEQLAFEKSQLQIQMTDLNRSLNLATKIDPMTGLLNRRAVMEAIDQELSRSSRHKRITSLIVLDLDCFSSVNDLYGFNVGDDVLVEVSRVLLSCLRNEDICSRWGGEEFLLLLPETNIIGAMTVANKIHDAIQMTEFKINKPGIRITASLGLSEYQVGQNFQQLISSASQALKQAKLEGKNQVKAAA